MTLAVATPPDADHRVAAPRRARGCATAVGALVLAVSASSVAAAPAGDAARLQRLADRAGCVACHAIDASSGTRPIGPAWRDVAERYRGRPGAVDELTRIVRAGSNVRAPHWEGKVAGLAMPPNAVGVDPRDARRLVQAILALDPQPAAAAR